ncbi:ABC transporter transmembrane region-domain-containing protein [Pisolithus albus]|nr:ABC transporter transmembrane region-domain-containing protein [Pisolithus albus]
MPLALSVPIAAGAAQPLMTLVFGRLVQDFVSFATALDVYQSAESSGNATAISSALQNFDSAASEFRKGAAQDASYLTYIGVGMAACTWAYMYLWIYTGEVNAKRIREKYLQSILRQDIAYFDHIGAGEVATRIQTDTHLVQQGISEKVALVINFLSAFVVGFILAFTQSWRLALAMSSILPCIAVTGGVMNKFVAKYAQTTLRYVAESGTIAEEVISTVRTAQAFGSQKVLGSLFNKKIDSVRSVNAKAAIWHGCGLGVFFFVIYSAYALAFDFGTTLINEGSATAGQVVNVFMAILIGSFSLALMAPEARALTNACGAAAKLYATIERVPDIDSASPNGLKPEKVIGEITLENVRFNYPARPDVPILKGIDITFEAGKTAALVGASGSGKSTIVSLVERFYDPLSGTVRLDGIDLRDLNIKWLRSQIGLVSQEPVLFATTIKANIAYGLIGTPYEHASEDEKFKLIKRLASSPMQTALSANCHKDTILWSANVDFFFLAVRSSVWRSRAQSSLIHLSFYSTRQPAPSIHDQRVSCRMLLIKHPLGERRLPLHTGCRRSRMLTKSSSWAKGSSWNKELTVISSPGTGHMRVLSKRRNSGKPKKGRQMWKLLWSVARRTRRKSLRMTFRSPDGRLSNR